MIVVAANTISAAPTARERTDSEIWRRPPPVTGAESAAGEAVFAEFSGIVARFLCTGLYFGFGAVVCRCAHGRTSLSGWYHVELQAHDAVGTDGTQCLREQLADVQACQRRRGLVDQRLQSRTQRFQAWARSSPGRRSSCRGTGSRRSDRCILAGSRCSASVASSPDIFEMMPVPSDSGDGPPSRSAGLRPGQVTAEPLDTRQRAS